MKNNKSIAVLPFVNLSNDSDNEYFSDGVTEEIINALTKIENLKVIARTSSFAFKGKNIDVRKVGHQLNVSTLLEGSVRKVNNRVRITAQLIDTKDGSHYWSKNFDKELVDIFKLQDDISLLIANEVRNNFGHFDIQEHLVNTTTNNVDAYELFLKGRYFQLQWTPESIKIAISFYDKAIAADKNYAKAYYANLQCYGLLAAWGYMSYEQGIEIAIGYFLKGKEINTNLPEYPLSFVGRSFWGEWNFKEAYTSIQHVLAMNPNHIDGLEAMAELFIANGFFKQALVYANKLLELDPLSANNLYTIAHIYYYKKDFETALSYIKKAISFGPDLELANHLHALCLLWLTKKQAFNEVIKKLKTPDLYQLLYSVKQEGISQIPNYQIEQWLYSEKEDTQLAPIQLFILANTNHIDEAFTLLQKYVQQKRGQIINYRVEPLLASLKQHKAYVNLHQSNLLVTDVEIPETEQIAQKNNLENEEKHQFKEKIESYFKTDQPYLNSQLTLNSLADQIEIHPNKLSFLINEVMGMNFNEFMNSYRLQHFKTIALNPKMQHITILGLAYDSGFNSKSVFNSYFKKIEGLTPSQWVKANQ